MENLPNISKHHSSEKCIQRSTTMAVLMVALFAVVTILAAMIFVMVQIRCDLDRLYQERLSPDLSGGKEREKRNTKAFQRNGFPGLDAIQLVGTLALLQVNNNGTIGPWYMNDTNLDWVENDGYFLTILDSGLYFVYAQIAYITKEASNSYEIIRSRAYHEYEYLTVCSRDCLPPKNTSFNIRHVTCYTGVISQLKAGDRLTIRQIEENRIIAFGSEFSYWGLVKLQENQF